MHAGKSHLHIEAGGICCIKLRPAQLLVLQEALKVVSGGQLQGSFLALQEGTPGYRCSTCDPQQASVAHS